MEICMKNLKQLLMTLILVFSFANLSFATSFSGYAGIKGDILSEKDSEDFDPIMELQAYFAGQLDFSNNFLVRAELSVQTEDILKNGLFDDTKATFCIDELSLTYIKPFLGITQYLSAFMGTFEPIGSDVFLQRHFGIEPITSFITESWLGLKGSTVYPFYGLGGSYIVHINNKPIATGIYIYKNNENQDEENQLNLDYRFSSVLPNLALDFAIGVGAPLETKNGADDVILLIDKLYLHTGIDLLLGNKYSPASLFLQGGFNNLPLTAEDSKNEIDSDDIYLIVEPRIRSANFNTHITMFSVPQETVDKLIFIDNTFGFNLSIFTDKLYIRNKDFTFGFHTTLSFPNRDFLDLKRINELIDDDYSVKISPFLYAPVMKGTLKAMLHAKIKGLNKDTWTNAFKFSIGYKSQL